MSIVGKSQSGRACAEPASRPSAPRSGGGAKRRALTSMSTRARCWLDDAAGDHNILRSTRVQLPNPFRTRLRPGTTGEEMGRQGSVHPRHIPAGADRQAGPRPRSPPRPRATGPRAGHGHGRRRARSSSRATHRRPRAGGSGVVGEPNAPGGAPPFTATPSGSCPEASYVQATPIRSSRGHRAVVAAVARLPCRRVVSRRGRNPRARRS